MNNECWCIFGDKMKERRPKRPGEKTG